MRIPQMTMSSSPSDPSRSRGRLPAGRTARALARGGLWICLAAAVGCFDPKIESGNLHCAPTDSACPDGFICSAGVCVTRGDAAADDLRSDVADGAASDVVDATSGDRPSDAVTCSDPVTALCSPAAGVTSACDPVCQTGCPCGQRCTVSGAGAVCTGQSTGSAKTLGQTCLPSTDDCAPGLACLRESCGSNLGRCYRFCRDASVCSSGVACMTEVNSSNDMALGQLACDLAEQTCNPIAGTGCPDAALSCFVTTAGHTVCDCPGRGRREGDSCTGYDDCALGLACLQSVCVRLCRSTSDCSSCTALGFDSLLRAVTRPRCRGPGGLDEGRSCDILQR